MENAWAFMDQADINKVLLPCKVQSRLKEICIVKQPQEQPQKSHEHDIVQKHLQIDRSVDICIP